MIMSYKMLNDLSIVSESVHKVKSFQVKSNEMKNGKKWVRNNIF